MIRPVKKGPAYACPDGFKPCNEFFFEVPGGQDYVVCIGKDEDQVESCPITSIAFEPSIE